MNDIEIRISVKDSTGRGLDAAKRQARDTGDHIARELARSGEKAGEGFERGLASKLTKGGNEGRGFFGRLFDGLADQAETAADAVGRSLAQIPVALSGLVGSSVATGGLNLLVGALTALVVAAAAAAAALIVLAPAVYLVAGSFGAANTLAVGLAATVATLVVGLGGFGDAWTAYGNKAAGGGRSASDAAHQVRTAVQQLADAQKAAVQAQEAVTRARQSEQERLEDLSRSLAGARLDEEGAVLAVQRAEQRLREARRGGNGLDYREAELALRQAKQTLQEVQDRVGDLSQEQDEANRKGVEGSDAVQSALDRQLQAQRQIEQATYALAQAQRGAGGGVDKFAMAMAALSPNARSFLETLFRLREEFKGIKRETQDRLFAGLDRDVERLATRSFPTLRSILTETATSLNGIAHGAMEALGNDEFLKDIHVATSAFDRTLDRIGEKTVPKLLGAIGKLARASVPFWDELSDMALGWVEKFSDKIAEADKDGSLDQFFKDATESLHKMRTTGGLVVGILGDIVQILMPASKDASGGFLDGVNEKLQTLKDWLGDEKNQEKIKGWIEDIKKFGKEAKTTAGKIGNIVDRVDGWTSKISDFINKIQDFNGKIKKAGTGFWNWLSDGFKTAINWVIDRWNGLRFSLPTVNIFGQELGGGSIGTIPIKRFDHGGIAGGLVSVAERSREAISTPGGGMLLALPQGSTVHPNGQTEAMLRGGGGAPTVVLEASGMDEFGAAFLKWFLRQVRVRGGGSVQLAFGKN